jgi:protein-tyrosine phosphatase
MRHTSHMVVPIRNAYWVVEEQLLAGEYPAGGGDDERRSKLEVLLDAGIRSFVDLTELHELRPYAGVLTQIATERGVQVHYRRMSIVNRGVPDVDHMHVILRHIAEEIDSGRPVYVHCWGGIGRTGTVVGCWLIERGTCAAADAIAAIVNLRRLLPDPSASPESPEQVSFVNGWIPSNANAALRRQV